MLTYDVVVLGATSLTARQVCRYLADRRPAVAWAAAGRNPDRIERSLAAIGVVAPSVLAADVDDPASLADLAQRTAVVLNLVGPYTRSAAAVIDACIASGTDYVDLSGEMPTVRRMQDRFDAAAREAGVKVVQSCGFEALPPDLALQLAAAHSRDRFAEALADVDVELEFGRLPRFPRPSDILSGGTIQSLLEVLADPHAAAIADPSLLVTDSDRAGAVRERSPYDLRPHRGASGSVVAPLLPVAVINPAVIHRSVELAGQPVLRYREGLRLPGGPAVPLVVGGAISAGYAGLERFTRMPQRRRRSVAGRLGRVLPSSGYGPAADRLDKFAWTLTLEAETAGGNRVCVDIEADGHPGYLSTARMIGEAGALLATADATANASGHVTPAVALGTGCAPAFVQAGMRIHVSDR